MKILELYRKDDMISSMLFTDRNDNLFTLSYISGNIEISIENDSVVIDDVLEAHEVFKERQRGKNNETT